MTRFRNLGRQLAVAGRTSINRSLALRYLRNRWRFPDLTLDPTVNVNVEGGISYGKNVSFGEGCNVIVPGGASLDIGDDCFVGRYVELGPSGKITLGRQVSIQDRSIVVGDVTVSSYCVLSLNVLLTSGRHYFDRWPHVLIRDQDLRVSSDNEAMKAHSRAISIGEDCWLGMNSVVMPGVTLGRGCIIGANSVVTRDLAPYSVAVGTPARTVRKRLKFSPPQVIDWRQEEHIPYFYSGFALSDRERDAHACFEGHVARSNFSVWLGTSQSGNVILRAKSVSHGSTTVARGSQMVELSNRWTELSFPAAEADRPMEFCVKGPGVVVGSAWQAKL